MSGAIDWEDFKKTYNQMKKTEYKTAVEWMTDLYEKHNKFVSPLSQELGLGFGTVATYLDKIGILEKKPRGGSRDYVRKTPKEDLFLGISEKSMKDLTRDQICKRCRMSHTTFWKLVRKYKRTYLKWKKGDSYDS